MSKRLTQEEFEERFYAIYDKNDFEVLSEYKTYNSQIKVLHKKCGRILTRSADNWLREMTKFVCECEDPEYLSQEEYEKLFYEKYGDKYTLVSYSGIKRKVKIKHNKCGEFFSRRAKQVLETDVLCPCEYMAEKKCAAITDPEFAKLFLNLEDAYKYSVGCTKKADFICPYCGLPVYQQSVSNAYKRGVKCTICKNNHSIAERIMHSLLVMCVEQLDDNKFLHDNAMDWSGSKRYDFIFNIKNIQYVVEMHGAHHYIEVSGKKFTKTLEEEQENDKYKFELATTKGGILPENYIVVDCRDSDVDFIKNGILHSKVAEILDLSNIDWIECIKTALVPDVKLVCDAWNEGYRTMEELTTKLQMNYSLISKCLKKGASVGLCDYTDSRKIRVRCKNDNIIFDSISEAIRHYDVKNGSNVIPDVCKGLRESAGMHPITGQPLLFEYA